MAANLFSSFSDSHNGRKYTSFLNTEDVRLGFIRKVLGIVSAQLVVNLVFVLLSIYTRLFASNTLNMFLSVIAAVVGLVIMCILCFSERMARTVPTNYALLSVFTLCESFCVATICKEYPSDIVVAALVMTAAVVVSLFIYAVNTKNDITYHGGLIFMISMGSLVLAITGLFYRGAFLMALLSVLGTISAGLYFIYDIQLLVGGHRFEISSDDYIRAALYIYVDIVRLFLKILKILLELSKENKEKNNKE